MQKTNLDTLLLEVSYYRFLNTNPWLFCVSFVYLHMYILPHMQLQEIVGCPKSVQIGT
jgi:hypothetical protein